MYFTWALLLLCMTLAALVFELVVLTEAQKIPDPNRNEQSAVLWAVASGQKIPEVSGTDSRVLTVRAVDLVESFRRESPYQGQTVLVPLTSHRTDGDTVEWWIGSRDHPAALVFRLRAGETVPPGRIWIAGRCAGAIRDDRKRETPGIEFYVVVEDCTVYPSEGR